MLVRSVSRWILDLVHPVIKGVSHASVMSVIPISCKRLISMQWLIISKAADKSSNTSTELCLLSRFYSRSLEILVSAVSVDFLGM